MYKNVIDVSVHQGIINWDKVKNSGVEFVILRAGYGKNNIDERFFDNANACIRYQIPFGIYWFSYAYSVAMAEKEAQYAIEAVSKYKITCPISFDLEYDTVKYAAGKGVSIGKELATKMAVAFCKTIQSAGYVALNYTNKDYMNRMFDMNSLTTFDTWYARYIEKCDRDDVQIWQKSSGGSVSGIKGKVDMNICYKEYASINTSETQISYRPAEGSILKKGSKGKDVEWLQKKLNEKVAVGLNVDGNFGKLTDAAVRKYQKKNGLRVDGKAGDITNRNLAG